MTYNKSIPTGSANRAYAERFATDLRKAMTFRGVSKRELASALQTRQGAVSAWRSGAHLPLLATATRLTEALDWASLVTIVREARIKVCANPICKGEFADESPALRKFYCSDRCAQQARRIRTHQDSPLRTTTIERRLREHQVAVKAMCESCEPDGFCRTGSCPLRAISPLPLARRTIDANPIMPKRPETVRKWAKLLKERVA